MRIWRTILVVALVAGVGHPSRALVINLNPAAGMSAQAIAGFQAAANLWQAILLDPVTVNIDIDFTALGAGILGSTNVTDALYGYGAVNGALVGDATSADDGIATANLPGGAAVNAVMNETSDNPNGFGSPTPYVDDDGGANNANLRISNANAKALGLLPGGQGGADAAIAFSTAFTFDFDPSDGIGAGAFDFVGVAAHEIGHALGFISGVDALDFNAGQGGNFLDNQFTFYTVMDLYRFSDLSISANNLLKKTGGVWGAGGNVQDWAADNRNKWFSIDGGVTKIAGLDPAFANGVFLGDGRQASHWKDNLGIGIMDPTAALGELLAISARDIQMFDVIGWDLFQQGPGGPTPVPEPGTLALLAGGLVLLRRRRRA